MAIAKRIQDLRNNTPVNIDGDIILNNKQLIEMLDIIEELKNELDELKRACNAKLLQI